MKVSAIEIVWHAKEPVFSVDAHPSGRIATGGADNDVKIWMLVSSGDGLVPKVEFLANLSRHSKAVNVVRFSPNGCVLASGGDDGAVILWKRSEELSAASGQSQQPSLFAETDDSKEVWTVLHILRSHLEDVYDLSWAPDSFSLISGSVDNSAVVWDATKGKLKNQMKDHKHYVQGVAWDPLNQFVITQSSDRSVRVYAVAAQEGARSKKPFTLVATNGVSLQRGLRKRRESTAAHQPSSEADATAAVGDDTSAKSGGAGDTLAKNGGAQASESAQMSSKQQHELGCNGRYYADESLPSFFRRPAFTPDGSILITPAGIWAKVDAQGNVQSAALQQRSTDATMADVSEDAAGNGNGGNDGDATEENEGANRGPRVERIFTTIVYNRGTLHRPIAQLPSPKKPTVAVRCCPLLFKSAVTPNAEPHAAASGRARRMVDVPYRMLFAVATTDSVLIYDTEKLEPVCIVADIHYATITDMCWTHDGKYLAVSSQDGYCSIVAFADGELGRPLPLEFYPPAMLAARESEKPAKKDAAADAKSDDKGVPVTPPNPRPHVAPIVPITIPDNAEPRDISSLVRRKPQAQSQSQSQSQSQPQSQSAPATQPSTVSVTPVAPSSVAEFNSMPVDATAGSDQCAVSQSSAVPQGEGHVAKKRRVVPTLVTSYE